MVSGNRIANECEFLATEKIMKGDGIEAWKIAILRLPSPIEEPGVLPAMPEAVLGVRDGGAAPIGVHPGPPRLRDPMPFEQIATQSLFGLLRLRMDEGGRIMDGLEPDEAGAENQKWVRRAEGGEEEEEEADNGGGG